MGKELLMQNQAMEAEVAVALKQLEVFKAEHGAAAAEHRRLTGRVYAEEHRRRTLAADVVGRQERAKHVSALLEQELEDQRRVLDRKVYDLRNYVDALESS